jgi:hypothetical protein
MTMMMSPHVEVTRRDTYIVDAKIAASMAVGLFFMLELCMSQVGAL